MAVVQCVWRMSLLALAARMCIARPVMLYADVSESSTLVIQGIAVSNVQVAQPSEGALSVSISGSNANYNAWLERAQTWWNRQMSALVSFRNTYRAHTFGGGEKRNLEGLQDVVLGGEGVRLKDGTVVLVKHNEGESFFPELRTNQRRRLRVIELHVTPPFYSIQLFVLFAFGVTFSVYAYSRGGPHDAQVGRLDDDDYEVEIFVIDRPEILHGLEQKTLICTLDQDCSKQ